MHAWLSGVEQRKTEKRGYIKKEAHTKNTGLKSPKRNKGKKLLNWEHERYFQPTISTLYRFN